MLRVLFLCNAFQSRILRLAKNAFYIRLHSHKQVFSNQNKVFEILVDSCIVYHCHNGYLLIFTVCIVIFNKHKYGNYAYGKIETPIELLEGLYLLEYAIYVFMACFFH